MSWRLFLLGELRIARGGRLLPLPPFRTHALLAALLLHPRLQQRHQLIGLLFPDMPEDVGRRRLSDVLYLLRQGLPALPLLVSKETVALPAEARWLDVEAFRHAVAQDSPESWQEALTLYQGDLLADWGESWLLEERESLRLQYLRLAHRACDWLLRRQQSEQALPLAERLVQTEPYSDTFLRTLMRLYQALGRRGAALAAYERFAAVMADDLGIEPEPATQSLAQSIRTAAVPARPLPLPPGARPDDMLRAAQVALERGQRAAVEAILERLRVDPLTGRETELLLLEADLALCFEEYERAGRALGRCPPRCAPALARRAELALEQRDWGKACQSASEALLLADESDDHPSAARALAALGLAQAERGELSLALRSGEQALGRARAAGSVVDVVCASAALGRLLTLRGQMGQARTHLGEALSLAREHGLLRLLAQILRYMAWIQLADGRLLEALETNQQALSVCRDLGMRSREAKLLQDLAYTYAQLGYTQESLRQLDLAHDLLEQFGDWLGLAINEYNRAGTLLYQDDLLADQASAIAGECLDIFAAHEQAGWVASTLFLQGHALWVGGHYSEALAALQEAYALHETMKELEVLPELLAHQAFAHLGLGQSEAALECTRRAVLGVAQGGLAEDLVSEVYYAHAMALAAAGDMAQSDLYLRRAYQKQLELAAQLQDEPARRAYFERDPIARRMMQEVYRRGMAPAPGAGQVTLQIPPAPGRAPVGVTLTLHAGPADLALKQAQGAIALRRARLARLLSEAQAQGTRPTVAQLAAILGASVRTIQRDMAFLRGKGQGKSSKG